LQITHHAREIASLMLGKYPHPSTIFPGGIGIEASTQVFNQVLGRIVHLLDYAKKVAAIWDDLVDFFITEVPEYQRVGERLRTIRSFNPCMPRTVHLYAGEWVLHRDATTCMCGEEG
jgi:Ni,Fe-hydrogenase I large subunit